MPQVQPPGATWRASKSYFTRLALSRAEDVNALSFFHLTVCEGKHSLSSFCRRGNGLRGHLASIWSLVSPASISACCLWHRAGRRVLTLVELWLCDFL